MKTEFELYDECLKGVRSAQKELFDRYASKMLGVCFRYSKSIEEAEDVLQDSFIRIFHYLPTFKKTGSLEGWVRKIVINTCLNNIKKNKHIYNEADVDEVRNFENDSPTVLENIECKQIMDVMQELPDGYKLILNLYAIEGYSHKEIAERLGIAEGTSRSQFLRAKNLFEKLLSEKQIYLHH
jgi:RNA polymerase sigma factor (sigma-70 family)